VSLGLPAHLASRIVNSAIALGAHVVATVVLGAAAVAFTLLWLQHPDVRSLPVAGAIALLALMLWWLRRDGSPGIAAGYLVIGAIATWLAASVASTYPPPLHPAALYVVTALQVALVMVGGPGDRVRSTIGFAVAGLAVGTVAAVAGRLAAGEAPSVDFLPLLSAVLVIVVYSTTALSRRDARTVQPSITQAAKDEKLAEMRSVVEARAAALLHDTVLGSLAAITTDREGELSDTLRRRIEADLDAIVDQDWTERTGQGGTHHSDGPIVDVIEEASEIGLEINLTGELGQLHRMRDDVAEALALALRQLLVNVQQHSGTDGAEVVLFGEASSVSVMVIDSGEGFDSQAVAPDRFGLRHSVQGRIEAVGGTVRVWSTPGKGTSVLLTVPSLGRRDSDDESLPMERTS